MKFDPEFIPDIGTNDVYLWGEAPNFGRVRFSIDSVILVDHLGVRESGPSREQSCALQGQPGEGRARLSPRFLAKTCKSRISSGNRLRLSKLADDADERRFRSRPHGVNAGDLFSFDSVGQVPRADAEHVVTLVDQAAGVSIAASGLGNITDVRPTLPILDVPIHPLCDETGAGIWQ